MKRVIDTTHGVTSYYHPGYGKKRVVELVQDTTPIIEDNKRLINEGKGYSPSRELRRIASIPNIVTLRWLYEDGVYWPRLPKKEATKYLRRKLSDPQYRYLRTSDGAL